MTPRGKVNHGRVPGLCDLGRSIEKQHATAGRTEHAARNCRNSGSVT